MSHVVTIPCQVRDLDALAEACTQLGLELVLGQKTFKWYGRFVGGRTPDSDPATWGQCDHAIRVKAPRAAHAYEIGLVQEGDHYALRYDSWCQELPGGLDQFAGKNLNKLRQHYNVQASANSLRSQGYDVLVAVQEDGSVLVQGVTA